MEHVETAQGYLGCVCSNDAGLVLVEDTDVVPHCLGHWRRYRPHKYATLALDRCGDGMLVRSRLKPVIEGAWNNISLDKSAR